MLFGLALACGRLTGNPQDWPTEARLVIPVANHLLADGGMDGTQLLKSWSELPVPVGRRPFTVTERALELARNGHQLGTVARAASGLAARPEYDPPLLRTIPLAIGCIGQGFMLRRWCRSVVSATHSDDLSQMAAFAVARLSQDLLGRTLDYALARTAQALREDAPESLIQALKPLGPGEAVPSGNDAVGILSAVVQSLSVSRNWEDAVLATATRGGGDDQAVLLTGALSGAVWGTGELADGLAGDLRSQLRSHAHDLVEFSGRHASDPLPPVWVQPPRVG